MGEPLQSFLDERARRRLLFAAVWREMAPRSGPGRRAKGAARPFRPGEEAAWAAELARVGTLMAMMDDAAWAARVERVLARLEDASDALAVLRGGGCLTVADAFAVQAFLYDTRELIDLAAAKGLAVTAVGRGEVERLLALLSPGREPARAFALADAFDGELAALRARRRDAERRRLALRQAAARQVACDLGLSLSGERVYVPVTEAAILIAAERHPLLEREGQTPFEVAFVLRRTAEEEVLDAEREALDAAIADRERAALAALSERLRASLAELERLDADVGAWDWRWARAAWGKRQGAALPTPADAPGILELDDAVHPAVAAALAARGTAMTPLTVRLAPGLAVVAGPNMSGKTVGLRTIGLCQALAQLACPVPARRMVAGLVHRVVLVTGDGQDVGEGLSSFAGQVAEVAAQLKAPGRALLLLDEIGRGTNPAEGEALAVALAEHLAGQGHTAVLVTHYAAAAAAPGARRYRVGGLRRPEGGKGAGAGSCDAPTETERPTPEVEAEPSERHAPPALPMDYRWYPTACLEVPRNALRIARWAGLPEAILARAAALLDGATARAKPKDDGMRGEEDGQTAPGSGDD